MAQAGRWNEIDSVHPGEDLPEFRGYRPVPSADLLDLLSGSSDPAGEGSHLTSRNSGLSAGPCLVGPAPAGTKDEFSHV
jgi:hypothetical protein